MKKPTGWTIIKAWDAAQMIERMNNEKVVFVLHRRGDRTVTYALTPANVVWC